MSTSRLSRRDFLKGTASLAVAASVPAVLAATGTTTTHKPWDGATFYEVVCDLMSAASRLQQQSMGNFSPGRDRFTYWLDNQSYEKVSSVMSALPPYPTALEYIRACCPQAHFCVAYHLQYPDIKATGLCHAIKNGHELVTTFDC